MLVMFVSRMLVSEARTLGAVEAIAEKERFYGFVRDRFRKDAVLSSAQYKSLELTDDQAMMKRKLVN